MAFANRLFTLSFVKDDDDVVGRLNCVVWLGELAGIRLEFGNVDRSGVVVLFFADSNSEEVGFVGARRTVLVETALFRDDLELSKLLRDPALFRFD